MNPNTAICPANTFFSLVIVRDDEKVRIAQIAIEIMIIFRKIAFLNIFIAKFPKVIIKSTPVNL